jgi:SEL1 protein
VGEIPQSYSKAKDYFLRVARVMWPLDFDANGQVAARRKMSKEMEDVIRDPAMVTAAFLGRMAMRGEGQKPDYRRARLWYERAAELVGPCIYKRDLRLIWDSGRQGRA